MLFGVIGLSTSDPQRLHGRHAPLGGVREQQQGHRQDHRGCQRRHSAQPGSRRVAVLDRPVPGDTRHPLHLHRQRIRRVHRPHFRAGHTRRDSAKRPPEHRDRGAHGCRASATLSRSAARSSPASRELSTSAWDRGLIALKIQRAIGQQMWLFVVVGAIGVVAAIWLVNLAAKPMARLMAYAVSLAKGDEPENPELLERDDEVGHLARLFGTSLAAGCLTVPRTEFPRSMPTFRIPRVVIALLCTNLQVCLGHGLRVELFPDAARSSARLDLHRDSLGIQHHHLRARHLRRLGRAPCCRSSDRASWHWPACAMFAGRLPDRKPCPSTGSALALLSRLRRHRRRRHRARLRHARGDRGEVVPRPGKGSPRARRRHGLRRRRAAAQQSSRAVP